MQKKKLELKKKTILTLSDTEKKAIAGGAVTTSFTHCTNVLCCGTGCTSTIKIHTPYPDNCAANSVPTWCPPA